MVYLQRLLTINIATLVALGTLLLGLGQRDLGPTLLVLIAAIASIWLTDLTGWLRLNRTVANVAALGAVLVSLRETLYRSGGVQILIVAKLLIYLQIILLFQKKDDRTYWQLVMLSLLQVVVASALNQGVWFGVLLVVYMLAGFSTLALMFLHCQWNRHLPDVEPPQPAAKGGRWPLAGRGPTFTTVPGGCGRDGVGRELFGRLGMMGLGTLALTLLVFVAMPRFGRSAWRAAILAPRQVVGFNDQVRLGALGDIIESPEEVMRVWLTEGATGRPYPVRGELYLRGAILTHYRNGQWKHLPIGAGPTPNVSRNPPVIQKIKIEPLRDYLAQQRRELFCIWPFTFTRQRHSLRFDRHRRRLLRPEERYPERFTYELGTTAFVDSVQVPLVPCDDLLEAENLLQRPKLPNLDALAEQWIANSRLAAEDRIGRARLLERELRDSGRFQYSLKGQPRNVNVDPIEDFIINNPRGHCEYFATALAMMLRSRGIPARVVVGYKCDEFNAPGKFFQVRQWHAHTWVEAYLQPEPVPLWQFGGNRSWPPQTGGWLRLDATPAADVQGAARRRGPAASWLRSIWENYVLEMDRDRQREAIYEPVARAVKNVIRHLRDPDWWRGLLGKIGDVLHVSRWGTVGRWLALGLMALLAWLVLKFVVRRVWRGAGRLWNRLAGRPAAVTPSELAEVEFYRRLETLLARHGLVRSAGQTQHEFATAAGSRIARTTGRPQLARLPLRVVGAFYHVRFGRRPLDNPQAREVELALRELADVGGV